MERTILVERRLRYTPRTCAACGKRFQGWGRARFCSVECKRRADYATHAEDRRAKRRARYRRQQAAPAK
jgi:hypothetical protein